MRKEERRKKKEERRKEKEERRKKKEERRKKKEERKKGERRKEKGERRKEERKKEETEPLTRVSDDGGNKQRTTYLITLKPLIGMSDVLIRNEYEGPISLVAQLFGRCHELMASFNVLTSCHWRRRFAPRCDRRRVLPHGSDSLQAVASVPAPSLDKTCTQSLKSLSCGVEPSPHHSSSPRLVTALRTPNATSTEGASPRSSLSFTASFSALSSLLVTTRFTPGPQQSANINCGTWMKCVTLKVRRSLKLQWPSVVTQGTDIAIGQVFLRINACLVPACVCLEAC